MSSQLFNSQFNIREKLLQLWPEMFPGIDRVVMLYVDEKQESGGREILQAGARYLQKIINTDSLQERLRQMAGEPPGYSWLHKDQLPFEPRISGDRQMQLFSEQYHIVLMVRLKPATGRGMDVYYLFFREDQSNFGISRLQGSLDTTRKALVGSLVYRFAQLWYQSTQTIQSDFQEFTSVTKQLLHQQQNDPWKAHHGHWFDGWAQAYLEELGQSTGCQLQLSAAAREKLLKAGTYQEAADALKNSARYALMLHSDQDSDTIIIEENYLILPAPAGNESTFENKGAGSQQSRLGKTILLLDRLEKAAQKLAATGSDLTGSAVGQTMERPITAPAITDALKKNSRRILHLLEKYPDRWQLIRQQFRPLQNLVEKREPFKNIG